MDKTRWDRIQAIFYETVTYPEALQRDFLEYSCGDDPELLADLSAMLRADRVGSSLLDRGLPEAAFEIVGSHLESFSLRELGPYRLIRVLGEGGMGVVWLAEREDTGHRVAIKFLPHANLSPARRERFAREIRTLARLKHSFIARLYDAGALDDGTPWFAMEYVEGVRLTEYCDAKNCSLDERIRLFRKLCEAVQYAHGLEVIHRDLKPSNILVEADGTPKLLDFGIARQLQTTEEIDERTRPCLRFVSPVYAAPEWVHEGEIGLFTDVYSLGVILYELLTGRLPAAASGAQPERPSVSAAGKNSSLGKTGRSDLDMLCLTAMHRDASRRYRSAEALLRDVDRYLTGRPLEAQPDSKRYRLRKFVSRNHRTVAAVTMTALLAAAMTVFFAIRLTKERNAALAEAARTRRIQRFMLDMFGGSDREAAPPRDLLVVTLLDRGVRETEVLNSDPETQAILYETVGRAYRSLDKHPQAEQLLQLSLEKTKTLFGPNDPRVADVLVLLGLTLDDQAKFDDAEKLERDAVAITSRLSPRDPAALRARAGLGRVLSDRGSYDAAIPVLEPLLRISSAGEEETYALIDGLTPLAQAEGNTGHIDEALKIYQRALDLVRQKYGDSHPRVAYEKAQIASMLANQGKYPEAEALYRQAVNTYSAWYGPDNPETASFESILALLLVHNRKYAEADPLLRHVIATQEQSMGDLHPYAAVALDTLGTLERLRGDLAHAEQHEERAAAIDEKLFGAGNHQTATVKAHLAQVFIQERKYDRAEPLLRQSVQAFTARPLPGNLAVGAAEGLLGRVLLREGRYTEAEGYLAAAYGILAKQPGTSYLPRLQEVREDLGMVYEKLRDPGKAAQFRQEFQANKSR